ncbi:MAG: gluconate 2-dehydrogenase subunit 3 family protein [Vulcanimicrobiaceae bacterium]
MPENLKRGDFFGLMGAVGAAAALESAPAAAAPVPAPRLPETPPPAEVVAATTVSKQLHTEPLAFAFLTSPEQAFLEAAVERLIPSDEHGPGAREADVAFYIDQQLRGDWGSGARQYRQGPWIEGTPEQGYQLNLIPQQLYRLGIAQTNAYCKYHYGKTFDALSGTHQDEVLHGLEKGTIALGDVPAKTFFAFLFENTLEGFWADPLYGGNRNKVGWKQIGFPGVAAAYVGVIEKYNVPYRVAPVGIADVEQGVAEDPDLRQESAEHRERVAIIHGNKKEK